MAQKRSRAKARGYSLHIGLNRVDPAQYEGWDGQLTACEADARDMAKLATARGFKVTARLLTKAATAQAVIQHLGELATQLKKGDILFLTYSGHGGQVKDLNGDEEKDRMDETWVLYDRQLVDDELYQLYTRFKAGVRIVVLSDSCHSGTVLRDVPPFLRGGARIRAMPTVVGQRVEKAHRALYAGIQKKLKGAERNKPAASVLLVSGCMDNQYSQDGDKNGLFTGTLKQVLRGKPANYRQLRDQVVARMPSTQTPNYYFVGAANPAFEAQAPFTI